MMGKLPTNVQRGDRLTAEQVRALAKMAEWFRGLEGQPPIYVDKNEKGGVIRYDPDPTRKQQTASVGLRWAWVQALGTNVHFVYGSFLKPGDDNNWVPDGDARPLFVPPNFRHVDYERLAHATWSSTVPVVIAMQIAGVWYIVWVPRWVIKSIPTGASLVRCP